jgi:multiple sugar transport system ATP-binding protein
MYVAGFIGIPTMNFIPVTVQGKTAKASGFEIDLPRAPGVEKGVLGIRPEAMTERPQPDHPGLELKVEVSEVLGPDQFLYGQVGGDSITARVDPQLKVDPGDRVRLGVDTRRLHLFEPTTGAAIL